MMHITHATQEHKETIFSIYRSCKGALDAQQIFQWTATYPRMDIVEEDLRNRHLYCLLEQEQCIGAITLNEVQEEAYATIPWKHNTGKVLVIHRLAVMPAHQGKGNARILMEFSEQHAANEGYSSIRLDAYSENKRVLKFYEQRYFERRGEVHFPYRAAPFVCYEKIL